MPPKKKPKESQDVQETNDDNGEADLEMFLQAFEKPTQIYRYLKTRNKVSPIFLHRNLWYMKQRNSVNNSKRKSFKVDDYLNQIETKRRKEKLNHSYKKESINITFQAFLDKDITTNHDVDVEALLLKVCHKKRKDVSSPVMQTSLGKVKVPVNPIEDPLEIHPSSSSTITISSDLFNHNNGHFVRSYVLVLKVSCPEKLFISNRTCNGVMSEEDEPPTKKRKNGRTSFPEEDSCVIYGSKLVIYDKYKRCLLSNGVYELALRDMDTKLSMKKLPSWETVMDGKAVGLFEVFNQCPTIKFDVAWSQRTHRDSTETNGANSSDSLNGFSNSFHDDSGICDDSPKTLRESSHVTPKKRIRLFYQFLYNNNTRQQTEARNDLRCPWCSLNCMQLYNLFKHLRLCHARFNFMYAPHPKGARVDVSINERYDGSYVGDPQDIHSHVGYAFSRSGPVRRTPVTYILVYRPRRSEPSINEFQEPENDSLITRQFIQGHNRLYFHTMATQLIRPKEIDYDSDDENYPLWLRTKTVQMIDEFTDVNEGEKELMKLWNLHVMKYNYIGDCQIETACQNFIEEHGKEIVEKQLCRNFLLHMVNLFDFSLIKPEVVQRTYAMLERQKQEMSPS